LVHIKRTLVANFLATQILIWSITVEVTHGQRSLFAKYPPFGLVRPLVIIHALVSTENEVSSAN
jgi:hypothetical protein